MALMKQSKNNSVFPSDSEDEPLLFKSDAPLYSDENIDFVRNKKSKIMDDNIYNIQNEEKTSGSRYHKIVMFILSMTIEPFMFLYMFSFILSTVSVTNLMMEKACLFHLNYTKEVCNNLTAYHDEKQEVEKITNNYGQYMSLIRMAPGAIVMVFVGPWSDKYGRKLPIIISLFFVLLDDIGIILNAIYYEARLEYLLISSIPSGFGGGIICIVALVYSLASETTSKKMRTLKYALVELGLGLGMALGTLAGGLLYKYYSYLTVFSVATVGHAIAIPWVILIVAETRGQDAKETWKQKFRELFSVRNLADGFKACMKIRENSGRCQLWLLLGSMSTIIITYVSFSGVAYIYAYHMFSWDLTTYSNISTIFSTIGMAFTVLCIPFFIKVLKAGDPMLGLVGTISMMTKNIALAFATKTWIYYMGYTFGLLNGLAMLAVRSRMSKIVSKDELGKVFSFLSTCESLIPLVGTIFVTRVYNATIEFFPGMCYLLAACFLILPLGTFIWMTRLKPTGYDLLKSTPDIQHCTK